MTTRINALSLFPIFGLAGLFASTALADEKKAMDLSPQPHEFAIHPTDDFTVTSNAGFAHVDVARGGCLDPKEMNGCSRFTSAGDVTVTAGTQADGLADGRYYFVVMAPGYQNIAYRDGMDGNLSDRTAGHTTSDDGSGDLVRNRTFEVKNHEIVGYKGPHVLSQTADGHAALSVGPFDETPNASGVYVLAMCPVGVVMPMQCRYDAFRIGLGVMQQRSVVAGRSYYDSNANGRLDQDEPMLDDGVVKYWDSVQGSEQVATDGSFAVVVEPDDLVFAQQAGGRNWLATGNRTSQAVLVGDATVTLIDDMSYAVGITQGAAVDGVQFGSVCLGDGGSRRLGYWASSISLQNYGPDDLNMLRALNLRGKDGRPFDPATIAEFQGWLRTDSGLNAYTRLSAQLAVTALNVHNGFVDEHGLVYMPDTDSADEIGIGVLDELVAEADMMLGKEVPLAPTGPAKVQMLLLTEALGDLNRNQSFVQQVPSSCAPQIDVDRPTP